MRGQSSIEVDDSAAAGDVSDATGDSVAMEPSGPYSGGWFAFLVLWAFLGCLFALASATACFWKPPTPAY